ncbi:MAG: sugar phosphate isomerase/epimerase [Haliscomenobacter sp.]|uniref:sugar phosphate isomerase/epimerase family protein n=1 Tax=Haliscomenobacter sp. TaxID=2717303 RepID=UPI0029BE164A|nr:sugar phosphate isomerase/epimerase [Haliscomenobacter sp.]MDX2067616.1 sugar phosphate isomerase/epimerase [Haliscomenobacter sp.]
MDRRTFNQLAISGSMAAFLPEFVLAKKNAISVQLYSVRGDMEKDLVGTLTAVRKMGYRLVEGAGYSQGKFYGKTPAEFKVLLADLGLKMPSGHFGFGSANYDVQKKSINDEYKRAIDDAASIGHEYVIAPYMIDPDRKGEKLKQYIHGLNKAGEYAKQAGVKFAYHNHAFEFEMEGGRLIYDAILQDTDPSLVLLQMDLYWTEKGKANTIELLKKNAGRVHLVHVKDMAKTKEQETVEVGQGSINFQEIFKYTPAAGVKYYVVELEHYKTTPMQGIAEAYNGLKKLKF